MSTTQGLSDSGHSASGSCTSTAPVYTTTTATVPHGDGYFIEEVSVTLGPDLPSIPVHPSPSSDDVIVVDVDLGSSTLPAVIHSSEACLPSLVLTTTAASTLPPHPPAAAVVAAPDAAGKHHQSRDYDSVAPFLDGSAIPVLHLDTADLHMLPGSPLDAVAEGSQRQADEGGLDAARADATPPRPPPPYSPHRLTGAARRLVAAVRAHRCQLCSFVALSSREVVDHLLVCHRSQLERLPSAPTSSQPAVSVRGATAAVVAGGESTSGGGSTSVASSMPVSRTVSVSGLARFVENKHGRMRLVATTSPPLPPTASSQSQQPIVSPTTVIVPSLAAVPADSDRVDDPPLQPTEAINPEESQQRRSALPTGVVLTAVKRRGRPRNSRSLGLTSSILPRAPTAVEQKQMGVIPCSRVGCGVRLRQADLMELHERCHAPEEVSPAADVVDPSPTATEALASRFVCFVCQYRSSQWTPMSLHLWRQHQIDLDLYRCNLCDFRTARYSQLVKQHLPTHGERRDHVCKLCHRRFKTTKQLYNHRLRVHRLTSAAAVAGDADAVEDKTLATRRCDDCQLLLSDRRALLTHRRSVHQAPSQRDRLQCAHCGRTFTCRSSLLLHERQHSGRRLSCEHCDFTSTDHNTLRRHRMRHTGDRPYRCPHCPYSCIQSAQFKRHLRYKHPAAEQSLVLSCSLCPFRTIQLNAYRRHLVSHQHDQPSVDVGNPANTVVLQDSSSSLELSDLQHRDSATCSAVKAASSDLQHRPLAPVSSLQDVPQDESRVSSSRQTFSVLVSSGGGSPRQNGAEPSIVTFSFLTPSSHSAELEHRSDGAQGSAVTLCEDAAPTL